MADVFVRFRGLFILARHTDFDRSTGIAKSSAEKMTVLFPDPKHGHLSGHVPHHATRIYFDAKALDQQTRDELSRTLSTAPDKFPNYIGFSLAGWAVELPPGEWQPVAHEADQAVTNEEPKACESDNFTPLSCLPNLNRLTEGALDMSSLSHGVQATVRLSGGTLVGVRSIKPMGRAYFEFFDNSGPVAVQRAIEDVNYMCPLDNGSIVLRLTPVAGGTAHDFRIAANSTLPIVIDSMPVRDRREDEELPPGLNHFLLYYPLLKGTTRTPLLRAVANCGEPKSHDRGGDISHVTPPRLFEPVPGVPDLPTLAANSGPRKLTTETGCPCLAAQVFAPLK